jgi:hypothetical protein
MARGVIWNCWVGVGGLVHCLSTAGRFPWGGLCPSTRQKKVVANTDNQPDTFKKKEIQKK